MKKISKLLFIISHLVFISIGSATASSGFSDVDIEKSVEEIREGKSIADNAKNLRELYSSIAENYVADDTFAEAAKDLQLGRNIYGNAKILQDLSSSILEDYVVVENNINGFVEGMMLAIQAKDSIEENSFVLRDIAYKYDLSPEAYNHTAIGLKNAIREGVSIEDSIHVLCKLSLKRGFQTKIYYHIAVGLEEAIKAGISIGDAAEVLRRFARIKSPHPIFYLPIVSGLKEAVMSSVSVEENSKALQYLSTKEELSLEKYTDRSDADSSSDDRGLWKRFIGLFGSKSSMVSAEDSNKH